MLKKGLHIVLVSSLAVLLMFGATAKEFVHLFAHHKDTIHNPNHVCPPGEAHLEMEHHHCSFLSDVLPPFANDAALVYTPRLVAVFGIAPHSNLLSIAQQQYLVHYLLRGPPISKMHLPLI